MDTENEAVEPRTKRRERRESRENRTAKRTRRPLSRPRKAIIAAGLAVVLGCGGFAAHEAFLTDAAAQEHIAEVRDDITTVTADGDITLDREAVTSAAAAETGEAFGLISNPLFGTQPLVKSAWDSKEMADAVAEDDEETLNSIRKANAEATQDLIDSGVVVAYDSLADPGQQGNFAVIGHRITHGSVFNRAVELREGDEVTVTTADGEHTYQVVREAFRIYEGDNSVLDSDPLNEGQNDSRALMTIITCGDWLDGEWHEGKWKAFREIVVLELVEE